MIQNEPFDDRTRNWTSAWSNQIGREIEYAQGEDIQVDQEEKEEEDSENKQELEYGEWPFPGWYTWVPPNGKQTLAFIGGSRWEQYVQKRLKEAGYTSEEIAEITIGTRLTSPEEDDVGVSEEIAWDIRMNYEEWARTWKKVEHQKRLNKK